MQRFVQWFTGISLYSVFNWLFDYVGYSLVIWKLGIVYGGLLMAVLAFLLDWSSIRLYDWSQTDWLALEYIKSLREYQGQSALKKMAHFLLTKTPGVIQVVFLSLKFNPFVTTTLMRSGAYQYAGMTRRDWTIFTASHLIGQLYWVFLIAGGVYGLLALLSHR